MNMFRLAIAALLVFLALPCSAKEPFDRLEGFVTKISDGDTIQISDRHGTKVKVRLYGVDAPETRKPKTPGQPYGEEALLALRSKVEGRVVRLDLMDVDQYKRTVAIIWVGNRNINKEMVAEGWAWAYRQYLDRPYASEYISAEEKARKDRKGLWQMDNPTPPWEFRKSLRKNPQVSLQHNWRGQPYVQ